MIIASSGTICTIRMSSDDDALRPRKPNRATAGAASSATSTASTVDRQRDHHAVAQEVQKPGRVYSGAEVVQRGRRVRDQRDVEVLMSPAGLNAVVTIQ